METDRVRETQMFQVRIHGRGGQGVVTAAEMLSVAAFHEGRHAQAFPSFGSERTGAPVVSYCRIDDRQIRVREPISSPDAVIVQDPTVLPLPGVVTGIAPGGFLIVNSARSCAEFMRQPWAAALTTQSLHVVPASETAREHLGRPLPNAVLLGAFAGITGQVSLGAVEHSIRAAFAGQVAEANVAAARAAFDFVTSAEEARHAAAG
jgi:pyruvate ferredoxin oxidoreductase gamma subunit